MRNNGLEDLYRLKCTLFEAILSDLILAEVSMQKKGTDVRRM
jgi:hypothetical protein